MYHFEIIFHQFFNAVYLFIVDVFENIFFYSSSTFQNPSQNISNFLKLGLKNFRTTLFFMASAKGVKNP